MGARSFADKARSGAIIEDYGFVSTSRSASVASQFRDQSREGISIKITVPGGSKGIDMSRFSDFGSAEQEILFPRKTRLKVLKFDRAKRYAEAILMSPKDQVNDHTPATVSDVDRLRQDENLSASRFVEDGVGLRWDFSEAVGDLIVRPEDLGE